MAQPAEAAILTPWSGICHEFREWEGLRIARRVEVRWELPEGPFSYFRTEATALTVLRRETPSGSSGQA